jgi:hypothetical protein
MQQLTLISFVLLQVIELVIEQQVTELPTKQIFLS